MALAIPLDWLIGLVGVGVPGFVLLNHLTGGSTKHRLTEDDVRDAVDKELALDIEDLVVADDQHYALVALTDGAVALAWTMESLVALRTLPRIGRVEDTGTGLRLAFKDAGFPKATIQLQDATLREQWQRRIGGTRGVT